MLCHTATKIAVFVNNQLFFAKIFPFFRIIKINYPKNALAEIIIY